MNDDSDCPYGCKGWGNFCRHQAPAWLHLLIMALSIIGIVFAMVGCAYLPAELPSQREARQREQAANSVLYCEVHTGHKDCKRVDRSEVDRILRGGL